MTEYVYQTDPFAHQDEVFKASRDLKSYAVLWEQGTGKSKMVIDTFAYLYEKGEIDGVLLVTPGGVHQNWINDEIPTHLPKRLRNQTEGHAYLSSRATTKWHQKRCLFIQNYKGLAVLAMSYSAFTTKNGVKVAKDFLKKRKVFYVIDESHRIKTPGTKRTRWVVASGKHAPFRRALTGTPIAQGPFDLYSQIRFLEPDFWKERGLGSYQAFKTEFGVFEQGFNSKTGKHYDTLVAYKNLDKLKDIVADMSSRVLKEDVLDLPPKLYSKRYVEISPAQRKLYKEIKDEYMATLGDGTEVYANLAIVRLLRLQQILCGYLPTEADEEPVHMIGAENPRMDALEDVCEDIPHQAIIFARFQLDIDLIMERLGDQAVQYDGRVDEALRPQIKEDFQAGKYKYFVGNPGACSEGLTLTAARTVVYYNNSFKLLERLQSEDRAHRIGQEHPVEYIDFVTPGTVDTHILRALREKLDIANFITGDNLKEWI